MSRPRSVALDVLRVLAILGVVAIHVFGYLMINPDARGTAGWWIATTLNIGSRWVVPGFVMVSGALLLGPSAHAAGPAAFYRKRLVRLGPAFFFWPLFYIVVVRILMHGEAYGAGWALNLFVSGTSYTAMYFLWLIAGLYLVAPVLAAFLNDGGPRRAYIFAGTTLAATLAVHAISNVLTLHGYAEALTVNGFTQWISYVGYFLAGWALRDLLLTRRWTIIVAIATVLLVAETILQFALGGRVPLLQALLPVGYFGTVVALIALGVFVLAHSVLRSVPASGRFGRVIGQLSAASFGVFLIHLFIIELVRFFLPGVFDAVGENILVAGAVWVGVIVVSFGVSLIARRIPVVRLVF